MIGNELTVGRIVETEAYSGAIDRASHAFKGKTPRTEIMFGDGGFSYIYLCYGIHHLFNVVTNVTGKADAVLIRGLDPVVGQDIMERRRGSVRKYKLTSGPGSLGKAMGFTTKMTGMDLTGDEIWLASDQSEKAIEIESDRRVGVDYAGEDAFLPWRFFLKDNPWVSVGKQTIKQTYE